MEGHCGGKSASDSLMWLIFIQMSVLWLIIQTPPACGFDFGRNFANQKPARRLHDIEGAISIDCGISEGKGYIDEKIGLPYTSDARFIETGKNYDISKDFISETLQKSLRTVRSFPDGNKNCYTLSPPEGKNTTYLIRASFMYGNYDGQNQLPEFSISLDVNIWDTVKFANASDTVIKEIVHVPLTGEMNVCLLKTGPGMPFISGLELRHFHDSSYTTQSGSLVLYRRLDVGSASDQIIRYHDDRYDRIWYPFKMPQYKQLQTSSPIDSLSENRYLPPSTVMQTAITSRNVNESLNFEFKVGNPTLEFYIYMHFAELQILPEGQSREYGISLNGNFWFSTDAPKYLYSETIYSTRPARGETLNFSIYATGNSTFPPILNAIEIYEVKDFLQTPTHQDDVDAMMELKYLNKNWQGDPCLPIYWHGLTCSSSGYDPPRIISLNLSSSGMTGQIPASLFKLKSLQKLDLSYNRLDGSVPDFLAQMSSLETLNLMGNRLSGTVPSVLLERKNNGSLLLNLEGNPNLCLIPPCKKNNNNKFLITLLVAIVSMLVVLVVLLTLWICWKRKRATPKNVKLNKQGLLNINNRQFTYSEVVTITNNFETPIGKGGSGTVYLGHLSDDTQVAVKMLSRASTEGSTMQFKTEAQLLMRIHHRNLASFVGYCNEGTNVGIIYEYMANGNLEEYLSDKTKSILSWKERLEIAVDAAQGLEYLHHGCKPPIIHRDVKSANILLNETLQAKIADFGFSRMIPTDGASHISTAVIGTIGYLDPEYYSSNRLTEKSDVYSFGIVLLELITGQPAIKFGTHIIQWVNPLLSQGDIRKIIDRRLEGSFGNNSVWKAMETAMACLPAMSIRRPTMSHVVMELKECLEIEIAHEHSQSQRMENKLTMRSRSSFENIPVDIELELGPQAR